MIVQCLYQTFFIFCLLFSRGVIGEVQQKTAVIYTRGDSGGGGNAAPGYLDHEIKDTLKQLNDDVRKMSSRPQVINL